ncbi:MAG: RidA family protein [Gammaproteobacteria bacterium]|nr:RidA family protein [Gammaproteobacteria bacterium]MCP5198722.1 RidA family protein [Gammaproteobacteria bacterium]
MSKRIIPPSMQGFYDDYHFAPAVVDGDHLRCAGVIGIDLATGQVPDDPARQFAQAFDNLAEVLAAGGASFADITEMTTFHVGLQQHLGAFMQVKDGYIKEPYPAWTAIGVSELAIPGGLVEIRVTARLR